MSGVRDLRTGTKATRNDDSLRKLFMVPENKDEFLVGEYGEPLQPSSGFPSPFSAYARKADARTTSDTSLRKDPKFKLVTHQRSIHFRDSIMTMKPPVRNINAMSPKKPSDSIPSVDSENDDDIEEASSGHQSIVPKHMFSKSGSINTMNNSKIRAVFKPAVSKVTLVD